MFESGAHNPYECYYFKLCFFLSIIFTLTSQKCSNFINFTHKNLLKFIILHTVLFSLKNNVISLKKTKINFDPKFDLTQKYN